MPVKKNLRRRQSVRFSRRSDCITARGRKKAGPVACLVASPLRSLSVAGSRRTAPAEAVVDAQLDGLLVIPEAAADDRRRSGGERGTAEIVILVLALDGPIGREQVLEPCPHGVPVAMVGIGSESDRRAANADTEIVVAPSVAAPTSSAALP